jgi:hypothetical protein
MKTIGTVFAAVCFIGVLAGTAKTARADDCLEIGWADQTGAWTWYHAWLDAMEGNRAHIRYDYHLGELELKVSEKEKADGEVVIILRGRWFEGKEATRTGRVFMKMERGHHHARGWYTFGDDESTGHKDIELRDCKRKY